MTQLTRERVDGAHQAARAPRHGGAVSNAVLAGLPAAACAAVLSQATRKRIPAWTMLREPGRPLTEVCFVEEGLVSVLGMEDGEPRVEVAGVGPEGLVGLESAFGSDVAARGAVTVSDCAVIAVAEPTFRVLLEESPELRRAVLACASQRFDEMVRLAVCNERHRLERRLARWILSATGRLRSDRIAVTHRDLARLLGVRRASVTEATHMLEGEMAIRSSRGALTVRERDALVAHSCGCEQPTNGDSAPTTAA